MESPVETSAGPSVEIVATLPAERVIGDPVEGIGSIDAAVRRVITSAETEVWIVNPFFDIFGAAAIAGALIGRARHGVPIRIIGRELSKVEQSLSLEPLKWLAERFVGASVGDRLQVRDFARRNPRSGRLEYAVHSKIVLADSHRCYIGSANVTEPGLRMNFELGVVLQGDAVISVRELVGRLWRASRPISLAPHSIQLKTTSCPL
jgi:phosphatidylserine/phosphatidylglycerophosphate/cardiolipin synthase-like enzyme